MRWRYDDPPLVWLFVASYAAHILEEYFGGFPEWFAAVAGSPLPRADFVIINALALGAVALAAFAATRRPALGWLAIGIATVAFINGLAHLLASLMWATYSPGLITGVILYLPLSQLALLRAWHQVPPSFFWGGVIAGLLAHTAVTLTALAVA